MSKKFMNVLKTMLAVMLIASCSAADEELKNTAAQTAENQAVTINNLDLSLAKLKAENCLLSVCDFKTEWNGAEIGDCYIWFNPAVGNEVPAYAEFKVVKNGENAGYIMVSLTEMDFEIPEYCTEGKTMYEIMQEKAETTEITAVRFSPFSYMAETKSISRGTNKKRVFLGTLEYLNDKEPSRSTNNDYENFLASYIESKTKLGGIGGSAEELKEFYDKKAQKNDNTSRGKPTPPYRYLSETKLSKDHLLPRYAQYAKENGFKHSGCTPTAVAMALGYWRLYHGKTGFFSSTPATEFNWSKNWRNSDAINANEKKVIQSLGSYMSTDYTENAGSTNSYNAWDGTWKYIRDRGYKHWVIRWFWVDHNSDEGKYFWVNTTNDWNNIYNEIRDNHPAILHYIDKDVGKKAGHSATIYGIQVFKDEWTGVVQNVHCDINTGWLSPKRKNVNANSYELNEVLTIKIW